MRNWMLGAVVLIAGCAPAGAPMDAAPAGPPGVIARSPALDKLLAGRTAGTPVSCINLPRARSSTTTSDPDTIIYRTTSRLSYVNQPAGGCNLGNDPILVTRTPSTRLCSGDIVQVIDRASRFPVGSCGLGEFVPFTRGK